MPQFDRASGLTGSAAIKVPCVIVATTNITKSGQVTIGSYTTQEDDRVLQAVAAGHVDNGIWICNADGAWSRATDFDGSNDATKGTVVPALRDSTGASNYRWYQLTTAVGFVIGDDALVFEIIDIDTQGLSDDLASSDGAGLIGWIQSGAGAVLRWVQDKPRESVSVKDFGALGDDTTDDYSAILAADTYASANGKALYFPAGIYCVGTMLNPTTAKTRWYGEGEHASILKRLGGATIASILHIGPTSGTSTIQYASFERLGFDGNSGCSDAVVKCRNTQHSKLRFLDITAGSADGLRTDTSTTTTNTNALRNEFSSIVSRTNGAKGFNFQGEKDTRFDLLFAHNNTGDGFQFKAFKDDGNSLCETTECTIGTIISRDNGGSGFVFDGAEKYAVGALLSAINSGSGLKFLSSQTGATSNGSNSLQIGSLISRNDALGGIRASDSCYVSGLQIANAYLLGFNSNLNVRGIFMAGVNRVHIGNCTILGFRGTAALIQSGTPLGVATESTQIHIDRLLMTGNGDASASTNHGLQILNSTSEVTVNSLRSANNQTSGTNYELSIASTSGPVSIGFAHLTASSAGNEENISTSDTHISAYKRRSDATVATLRDGVTAPTANLSGHAQLYIDSADGDYKVRFSDGTVKTIVIDT